MAQSKIIKHKLEDLVLEERRTGRSLDQMVEACNTELTNRNVTDRVTKSSVKRYLATLDKATLPAVHEPQVAEENARVAIDVYARLQGLDERLQRWIREADDAVTPMKGVLWDPQLQAPAERHRALEAEQRERDMHGDDPDDPFPEYAMAVTVLIPDWGARLGTAKEVRQHAEAVANLLERIHNAQQVQEFQKAILTAIEEADPATANRILEKLRALQTARTLVAP